MMRLLILVAALWSRREPVPLGLDIYMPVPEDNLLTAGTIARGRSLFFNRALSRDQSISCATCHDPRRGFSDGRAVSLGVFGRRGMRNAPTLINRGYGNTHFWDGRAKTLEQQVLEPILNSRELDLNAEELEARTRLRTTDVAKALASYVRTIRSGNSAYDRHVNGRRGALTEPQRRGLILFRGKAGCSACHAGPNLTDECFHNTGVAWRGGALLDEGRFRVTGSVKDRGAFKTPTLREVARTGPYMHDGSLASLEEVLEFYDRGGNRNPSLDPSIRALHLTMDEKQDLIAFLRSLTGRISEGQ